MSRVSPGRLSAARACAAASIAVCALGGLGIVALAVSEFRRPASSSGGDVGAGMKAAGAFFMLLLLIPTVALCFVLAVVARRLAPDDPRVVTAFGISLMAVVVGFVVGMILIGSV